MTTSPAKAPRNPLASDEFTSFDWQQVFAEDNLDPHEVERFADAVRQLLEWVLVGGDLRLIGIRTTALAWVVNPALFDYQSASQVARRMQTTKANFSKHCADASKTFGVRNVYQAHGLNGKHAAKNRKAKD